MKIKINILKEFRFIDIIYISISFFCLFNIITIFDNNAITMAKEILRTEGNPGLFIEQSDYDIIMCNTEVACLHEVGHWVDKNLGYPSKSDSFKQAIDLFIENCEEKNDSGDENYYCNISSFAGVNGNPMFKFGDSEWGGYVELYATIYEIENSSNIEFPEELIRFYQGEWNE